MLLRTELTLTYDGACAAVAAAVRRAEDLGIAVNVAVTDRHGGLLAFARMDGAFAASGAIAQDKAWTVTGFGGAATDDLYDAIAGEAPVRDGIGHRERVAAFGGGVPVVLGGAAVGAVGVSGGSALQDKEVAEAGATAVVAGVTGATPIGCHRAPAAAPATNATERTLHDPVHATSC